MEVLDDCASVSNLTSYERLLRGSAAAKSLSRRRRLHHRCGIHHSDRFGGFSGVGVAKLDIAPCRRALVDRISDRIDSGLGLRRHSARYSRNASAYHARIAPSSQFDNADRYRRNHFCRWPVSSSCPELSARKIDKSIAVLPFQNLSDEKENAYFADGMQDDILTNLSKIGDLKVISRMSVMSYRGDAARNAREIGKALGVGTLLEGSVRRIGNRVRVNVQLINANNDEHIWAEDYDRDLTDVFAIQTDLAQKIASALQAKLSPNEKARLDHRPTQNPDAYLLFVQAHDYANRTDMFRDTSLKAEQLFEQAIKLDPNFAAAFAGLSMVESWIISQLRPAASTA